jgi:hypothetical protein
MNELAPGLGFRVFGYNVGIMQDWHARNAAEQRGAAVRASVEPVARRQHL